MPRVADVMEGWGFHREEMGGGCDAWAMRFANGSYVLVTEADTPSAPDVWAVPVVVSVWSANATESAGEFRFPKLTAALQSLDAWLCIAAR